MGTAKTKIMQLLGFAGLIPFLVFSLAQLMGVKLPLPVAPMTLLLTYGAIILSFLAGILWGRAIHRADSEATNSLLVLSNAFALLAWFSLLLDSVFWALLIQMAGFALVLTFERVLARGSLMTTQSGYYPMRLILTAGVIVCQLLVLGNHIF
ncbi:MAG: DUF3429 domain-containing protein [Pseudomonadota bacterium]